MDKKKMAAAMAAVYMTIRTGEEAAAAAAREAAPAEPEKGPAGPGVQANVWGLSGRQTMMNANTMIQMRAFK